MEKIIRKTWILGIFFLTACSVDSARNHYVLAEKLWTDRKYAASVSEFEKVISRDPRGKLGLQAMYRAATTQYLFLSRYNDAIRNFKNFIQVNSEAESVWDAELQIGEILFSKTEQYDQALVHYRNLLKQKPQAAEAPELLFRVGKSQFFLLQFDDAVATYKELTQSYPKSIWAEKASLEIGTTYFTRGEQQSDQHSDDSESYQEAIQAYQKFTRTYPKSEWLSEARFGIASCLEELDRLNDAYETYESLKKTYPSPQVVEIKLLRIRERMSQRKPATKS